VEFGGPAFDMYGVRAAACRVMWGHGRDNPGGSGGVGREHRDTADQRVATRSRGETGQKDDGASRLRGVRRLITANTREYLLANLYVFFACLLVCLLVSLFALFVDVVSSSFGGSLFVVG